MKTWFLFRLPSGGHKVYGTIQTETNRHVLRLESYVFNFCRGHYLVDDLFVTCYKLNMRLIYFFRFRLKLNVIWSARVTSVMKLMSSLNSDFFQFGFKGVDWICILLAKYVFKRYVLYSVTKKHHTGPYDEKHLVTI